MAHIFNVRWFKVGGIRFLKLGRINLSVSVSKRQPVEQVYLDWCADVMSIRHFTE